MTVVVFGGTGVLGRRVVRHLLDRNRRVRIASPHPDRALPLFPGDVPNVESVRTDAYDERSVASAPDGAGRAVNAISLYVEYGNETFD